MSHCCSGYRIRNIISGPAYKKGVSRMNILKAVLKTGYLQSVPKTKLVYTRNSNMYVVSQLSQTTYAQLRSNTTCIQKRLFRKANSFFFRFSSYKDSYNSKTCFVIYRNAFFKFIADDGDTKPPGSIQISVSKQLDRASMNLRAISQHAVSVCDVRGLYVCINSVQLYFQSIHFLGNF